MKTKNYKSIAEFTPAQIKRFDAMHVALRQYNEALRKGDSPMPPAFTDNEMSEYSTYRELLLASQC